MGIPLDLSHEMSTETVAAPSKFDECMEVFGEAMKQSYTINEDGDPKEIDEEEMTNITNIVDAAKDRVQENFRPLFSLLEKKIADNKLRIEELQAKISNHKSELKNNQHDTEDSHESSEGLPTVEWLISNRKSKSSSALTGYNAFTMWYMAQNKSGFPPKGIWEQQNKAAWNALAAKVNKGGHASSVGEEDDGESSESHVEIPDVKGKGQKVTAYNMYTIEYMKNNPGKGFPPKGSWSQVSKEDVARYQAQADMIKNSRA